MTSGTARISVRDAGNSDSAAALSAARARLTTIAKRCQREKTALFNVLYYGQRSQLEETIDDLPCTSVLDAVVTRNHYGCLVLNAAHALFIDVDMLTPSPSFHPTEPCGSRQQGSCQRMLSDLRTVLGSEPDEGFRIYRTAAGFRILAVTHEFEPGSRQSLRLMSAVGADDAFVKLCRTQNSFRARLTPKPWRCGAGRPPNSFPREFSREQHRFATWRALYEQACRDRATCQFLEHIGPTKIYDPIGPIVEVHDRETRAFQSLPLA
jgi:hypothetical protein